MILRNIGPINLQILLGLTLLAFLVASLTTRGTKLFNFGTWGQPGGTDGWYHSTDSENEDENEDEDKDEDKA